jgi:hypothetical protein
MPQRTLQIDQPIDAVWEQLQRLETWEGIGGMGELHDPVHGSDGALRGFGYSLHTPVGTIHDNADVTSQGRVMHVRTATKGVAVTIDLALRENGGSETIADFAIDANATNFLAAPLAASLRHTLESGIVRECDRMVERLEASDVRE